MPLYEYICSECGASFEKLVMSSRRDEVECSKCGSSQTERQISSFSAGNSGGGGGVSLPPTGGFS